MSSSWDKQLNLIVSDFVRVHFENKDDHFEKLTKIQGVKVFVKWGYTLST